MRFGPSAGGSSPAPESSAYVPPAYHAPAGGAGGSGGGSSAPADKPFKDLGTVTANPFYVAPKFQLPDQVPQPGEPGFAPPEAFKGVPVLEQAAQVIGGIANIPAAVISAPSRLFAAQSWANASEPDLKEGYANLVQAGALAQDQAEAMYRRAEWEKQHAADKPALFHDLFAPTTDYSLGGQVLGAAGQALSVPQKLFVRFTGGNLAEGYGLGSVIGGSDPESHRLASLLSATDAQLNYGAGDAGHPELIAIRDKLKSGEYTADQAFDALIEANPVFGVSNPSGTVSSFVNSIFSDPSVLLGGGAGVLAKVGARAIESGAIALAKEIGSEGIVSLGKRLTEQLGEKGLSIASNHENLLTHALRDTAMQPQVEAALKTLNPVQRFMIRDLPGVLRMANRIQRVTDPLSFFGTDNHAVMTAEKFSQKAAWGAVKGYGPQIVRSLDAKLTTAFGEEAGNLFNDAFDGAAAQIVAQVGMHEVATTARFTRGVDSMGSSLIDSAQAAARRMGNGITGAVQSAVETTAWRLPVLERGEAGVAAALSRARSRAVDQIMSIGEGKVDRAAAEKVAGTLNEKELSLLDFQHYYKAGQGLADASRAAVAVGMPNAERLTLVGPRQLSSATFKVLKTAIKKGDIATFRGMIQQYDDLYRLFADDTLSDADLLAKVNHALPQLAKRVPEVISDTAAMAPDVKAWAERYGAMGYHVGLRPLDEHLARPVTDEIGNVIGVKPWVDFVDTALPHITTTRFKAWKEAVLGSIGGDSILRDAQFRFSRIGAERFGLPEAVMDGMFRRIQQASNKEGITTRALRPQDMYEAAMGAGTVLPKALRGRITQREVAELVMEAHEGSLSKVGLTQKFTGAIKTGQTKLIHSTSIARLSGWLYPAAKFTHNPFFQFQEMLETPFFMLMRGRVPMQDVRRVFSAEGRAAMSEELDHTLWVMHLINGGSDFSEAMTELSGLSMHGNGAVTEALRSNDKLAGRLHRIASSVPDVAADITNVHRMKEWGHVRAFQYELAGALKKSMNEASPESWRNYATWMEHRAGFKNDQDAITSFLYDHAATANPDAAYAKFGAAAFKPAHLGPQEMISTGLLRGLVYGHGDGRSWDTLLKEVQTGTRSAREIDDALTRLGADPIYVQRAVNLVTTPTPKAFADHLVGLGRPAEEVAAFRDHIQRLGSQAGIGEHEMLSRLFDRAPIRLDALGDAHPVTYFQTLSKTLKDRGLDVLEDSDPRLAQITPSGWLDMSLPDNWETTPLANLTSAQRKAREYQMAARQVEQNPDLGRAVDPARPATISPETQRAIQSAYDRGDSAEGQRLQREATRGSDVVMPGRLTSVRDAEGNLVHRIGEPSGDEWWQMIDSAHTAEELQQNSRWYPDMRKSVSALVKNDPEEARRQLLLFGLSQLNTSPTQGLLNVYRSLAKFERDGVIPVDKAFSGLNAEAIGRLITEGDIVDRGLGQKLIDFIDSLLGKRDRTAGYAGPDPMKPWNPVAGDIWAKRDLGYLDDQMSVHLGHLYGGKATYEKGTGFTVTDRAGKTFVIPDSVVTGGVPSNVEYHQIVRFYNERAGEANARQFLGRTDWSAADMQALGWFRAKKTFGDFTGQPHDALMHNVSDAVNEVAPTEGAPYADIFPGNTRPASLLDREGNRLGRITNPQDVADLHRRGTELLSALTDENHVVEPLGHLEGGTNAARRKTTNTLFKSVQSKWGGTTYDPRTGTFLHGDAVFHGTLPTSGESIAKTGMHAGSEWTPQLAEAQRYALARGPVYRTRQSIVGQPRGADGIVQGSFVRPTELDVLHSDGSFAPLSETGSTLGGPYASAIGETSSMPIAAAGDRAAFTAAFDAFIKKNHDVLGRQGTYVGVFRDERLGVVQFDVNMVVDNHYDAEAIQTAAGREGGAYDFWSGNGVYAPTVGPVPDGLPPEVSAAIANDMGPYLSMEADRIIGTKTLSHFNGVGTFEDAMNPNSTAEVVGDFKDVVARARVQAVLAQRDHMPVIKRAAPAWQANQSLGRYHALEWSALGPDGARQGLTWPEAREALARLQESHPLARKNGMIFKADDGTYGVQAVWLNHDFPQGNTPLNAFKEAAPATPVHLTGNAERKAIEVSPERVVVHYDPVNGSEADHIAWLKENGYAAAAEQLDGPVRRRVGYYGERVYQKHAAGLVAQHRAARAIDDPQWEDRAGPLLGDIRSDVTAGTALDATAGPDLLARAGSADRNATYFQRVPRGTLGATAFSADSARATVALGAGGGNPDTLLHELSHVYAEHLLDPSGRKAVLDTFNAELGRLRPPRAGLTKVQKDAHLAEVADYQTAKAAWEETKKTYDDAVAALDGAEPEPVEAQALYTKWADRENKNHLHMERDLTRLEQNGYDVHDALDNLDEYRNVERSDFSDHEEYQQARDDAWQQVIDDIDALEAPMPDEVPLPHAPGPAPVPPTAPIPGPAAPRAALTSWTPEVHEWFAKHAVEYFKTGESPAAHLTPLFEFYRRYLKEGLPTHRVKMSADVKALFDDVLSKPIDKTVTGTRPDEAALLGLMVGEAHRADRAARDLTFFKTNRSWLERSVNHPYFGLYPASYMWGKVLPEFMEFMLARPFGLHAPIAMYSAINTMYRSVLQQQANDPAMQKYMQANEPAWRVLSLALPALPWDIPANTPLWFRRVTQAIADQNLQHMEGKLDKNGNPVGIDLTKIDWGKIVTDSGTVLNPLRGAESVADVPGAIGTGLDLIRRLGTGSPLTDPKADVQPNDTGNFAPSLPPPGYVPVAPNPLLQTLQTSDTSLTKALTP